MSIVKNAILGAVVGDALGVPAEFETREYLQENSVTDMRGYGTYNQPPGTWSDDSSLTLCLAESLFTGYDLADIARKFVQWRDAEIWTPHGEVFDIGNTTSQSIEKLRDILNSDRYELLKTVNVDAGSNENGNGSLMRILPLYFYIKDKPVEEHFRYVKEVSALTHGHIRSVVACFIYLRMVHHLIAQDSKEKAYMELKKEVPGMLAGFEIPANEIQHFDRILKGNIASVTKEEIRSSGYVIDSLEASLWSLLRHDNYKDTVLEGVNLGGDTDTTATIAGGLAGIVYGVEGIPVGWVEAIARKDDILKLCDRLQEKYSSTAP